jgi:hypothetical protein
MASIYPDIEGVHATSAGQARELEVVGVLGRELPDDFSVFHGALMSSVSGGYQQFGEIDAIVLAPNGAVVILEIKAGTLVFSDKGIQKQYADRVKDVSKQIRVQYTAFRQRLKEAGLHVGLAQFLVTPDMRVDQGTLAYPRERIIDRADMAYLAERVLASVSEPGVEMKTDTALFEQMRRFLGNVFALSPDPTARMGWLNKSVMHLSEGLATWVMRVHAPQNLYVIRATAGSGKTQLALRVFEKAISAGQRACYVCFNRPLADHVRAALGASREAVVTFHELAVNCLRHAQNGVVDFTSPDVYKQAEACFEAQNSEDATLDVLLIDEAQDFSAAWVQALLRRVRPDGRVYVLLDEGQALYARDTSLSTLLTHAVDIHCWDNFRSPRNVVHIMNALHLTTQPIDARCPLDGDTPGFHRWDEDDVGGIRALHQVVEGLLVEGIEPEQMAVLSFVGRERSQVFKQSAVAGVPLRQFAGRYTAEGQPQWSEGRLLADTVHRFKGQAAPVVILCEVDFAKLDDNARHRLFVGMTRAQWRLEVVLSPQAEAALIAEFQRAIEG